MLRSQEEVIYRHAMQLDEVVQTLTSPDHTLGLIFVLHVRASAIAQAGSPPGLAFLHQCRALLTRLDPAQVALAPMEVSRLCAKFLAFALDAGTPLLAVKPLIVAAQALQPGPAHFTPVHPLALQACILAKCYSASLALIGEPLIQVDPAKTAVTAQDVLLTHYHGGIALVGLKRHAEALQFFQLVIAAPTLVFNTIMVEAYKKWLLCGLIANKAVPVLPRYTATTVQRSSKGCAPAYVELGASFASRDLAKLQRTIATHAAVFEKDSNTGLVKQCATAFTKDCIQRLSRTYVTLSLVDIASAAGLSGAAEAEAQLLIMVDKGEIKAQIDRVKGMALFSGDADVFDSNEMKTVLDARLEQVVTLSHKLRDLHDDIAGDVAYVSKMVEKGDRSAGRWAGERAGAEDMAVI
mmetsp:Transcript_21113/g.56867  ORF Transcript_21113/g.56867 Transcript_21113/m.56867 type:complete len:409 (-) Transcript_21113:284-1510(-)